MPKLFAYIPVGSALRGGWLHMHPQAKTLTSNIEYLLTQSDFLADQTLFGECQYEPTHINLFDGRKEKLVQRNIEILLRRINTGTLQFHMRATQIYDSKQLLKLSLKGRAV